MPRFGQVEAGCKDVKDHVAGLNNNTESKEAIAIIQTLADRNLLGVSGAVGNSWATQNSGRR